MDPWVLEAAAGPRRTALGRRAACLMLTTWLSAACGSGAGPEPGPAGYLRFMDAVAVPGARVRVTGCPEQISGSDGRFSTDCAAATYDVQFKLGIWGIAYQGLTRRDPVVTAPFRHILNRYASVTGSAAGLTGGRAAAVALVSPELGELGTVDAGSFTISTGWFGVNTHAATLHLLEWTPTTGLPSAFTGHAAVPVTITGGGESRIDPVIGPVANGSIAVATDLPDASGLTLELWTGWPGGGATPISRGEPGNTSAPIATPVIPGATYGVVASAAGNRMAWRAGLPATASPATLVVPPATSFASPAPGSTVGLGTVFDVNGLPGTVNLFTFANFGAPTQVAFVVVTAAHSVRIPDFAWAGLVPVPASSYLAQVIAVGPFASVDDAASLGRGFADHPWYWGGSQANRLPASDGFAASASLGVMTP